MQQEKIVLPKFTVPGQRNWVAWVLAGVGTLVVVNLFVLAGVVISRGKTQPAAAAATVPREEVPLAPSATPVPPPQAKTALAATATPPADVAKDEPAASAKPARSHHSHHARSSTKTLAHAGGTTHSRSVAGKGDALDELLKKFK